MTFLNLFKSSHLTRNIFFLVIVSCLFLILWLQFSVNSEHQEWDRMFAGKVPYNTDILAMEDPRLVTYLREGFLLPPPPPNEPLNLSSQWIQDTSMGQAARIREILEDMRGGFFIECGALDGEIRSNTLVFERQLNWSGLLIEADPLNYAKAVPKHRRVYLSNSCLSIKPYPMMVSFYMAFNMGKIEEDPERVRTAGHANVQCFPLYTYLLALNRTTVDYFSLDVEGNELEVLENIPWDKVNIRTLSVEYIHGTRGKNILRSYMEKQGYYVHSEVVHSNNLANDFIFVKNETGS